MTDGVGGWGLGLQSACGRAQARGKLVRPNLVGANSQRVVTDLPFFTVDTL